MSNGIGCLSGRCRGRTCASKAVGEEFAGHRWRRGAGGRGACPPRGAGGRGACPPRGMPVAPPRSSSRATCASQNGCQRWSSTGRRACVFPGLVERSGCTSARWFDIRKSCKFACVCVFVCVRCGAGQTGGGKCSRSKPTCAQKYTMAQRTRAHKNTHTHTSTHVGFTRTHDAVDSQPHGRVCAAHAQGNAGQNSPAGDS